ncbi:MAG: hypothetical protein KGL39_04535 [Patescibacteria group bacterium]|nr:hypothetical protein [Patescibacteria group bacterium]
MLPITVSLALSGGSATAVAAAQTLGSAGNFTLTANPVVFTVARRVLFTFAADETGHTFPIYGTDRAGNVISENITGTTAGTVYTVNDYLTVTQASCNSATTGNVSIGTTSVGSSRWVYTSDHMTPFNLSLSAHYTSGSGSYQLEYCYDDPAGSPATFPAKAQAVTVYALPGGAQTGAYDTSLNNPITAWRLTVLTGTGTVSATGIQSGISGP